MDSAFEIIIRYIARLLIFIFSISTTVAGDLPMIEGRWTIDSFKESSGISLVMGDGRDTWEFTNGKWTIYSSGKKISSNNFTINGSKLMIDQSDQINSININYIRSNIFLQLEVSEFTYNLTRID